MFLVVAVIWALFANVHLVSACDQMEKITDWRGPYGVWQERYRSAMPFGAFYTKIVAQNPATNFRKMQKGQTFCAPTRTPQDKNTTAAAKAETAPKPVENAIAQTSRLTTQPLWQKWKENPKGSILDQALAAQQQRLVTMEEELKKAQYESFVSRTTLGRITEEKERLENKLLTQTATHEGERQTLTTRIQVLETDITTLAKQLRNTKTQLQQMKGWDTILTILLLLSLAGTVTYYRQKNKAATFAGALQKDYNSVRSNLQTAIERLGHYERSTYWWTLTPHGTRTDGGKGNTFLILPIVGKLGPDGKPEKVITATGVVLFKNLPGNLQTKACREAYGLPQILTSQHNIQPEKSTRDTTRQPARAEVTIH